jgi:hypothetical protein
METEGDRTQNCSEHERGDDGGSAGKARRRTHVTMILRISGKKPLRVDKRNVSFGQAFNLRRLANCRTTLPAGFVC